MLLILYNNVNYSVCSRFSIIDFLKLIFYLSFNINISIYYKNSICFNNNNNLFLKYCLDSNCISPRAHLLRHVASGSGGRGLKLRVFFNQKKILFFNIFQIKIAYPSVHIYYILNWHIATIREN